MSDHFLLVIREGLSEEVTLKLISEGWGISKHS